MENRIGLKRFSLRRNILILLIGVMFAVSVVLLVNYLNNIYGADKVFIVATGLVYLTGLLVAITRVIIAHKEKITWKKVYAYGHLLLLIFLGGSICFIVYIS